MSKIVLQNDDATNNLGRDIAKKIIASKSTSIEIHLEGDLGAGKTFLTRSIIQNSGWQDIVKSPTYTLCEEGAEERVLHRLQPVKLTRSRLHGDELPGS